MIDKNKQYKTRDGREVRIYAVEAVGEWPVHGAILDKSGWRPLCWLISGSACSDYLETDSDLIEVKPRIKREVWVNVYRLDNGQEYFCIFDDRRSAEEERDSNCIACVKLVIDCEEGEGL